MGKKTSTFLAFSAGVILIILAFVYFINPANNLPHFIPGYSPAITRHHVTHGIASLFLGLLAFAFAWFRMGAKSVKENKTQDKPESDTVDSERP